MIQPISLAFCGHLGHTELAAVALALSVRIMFSQYINVFF